MIKISFVISLFLLKSFVISSEYITVRNYGAVSAVRDVALVGDTLFVATDAGLITFNTDDGSVGRARSDIHQIRGALRTEAEELWYISSTGVLTGPDRRGRIRTYEDMTSLDLRVYSFKAFGENLIIGHSRGISVFSLRDRLFRSSVSAFANLGQPDIVDMDISLNNDTLYVLLSGQDESYVVYFPGYSGRVESLVFTVPSEWAILDAPEGSPRTMQWVDDSLHLFSSHSLYANDTLYWSDDSTLYRSEVDGSNKDSISLKSRILCIEVSQSGELYIGTEWNGLVFSPFLNPDYLEFEGIYRNDIQRIFLTSDGDLWVFPVVVPGSVGSTLDETSWIGRTSLAVISGESYREYDVDTPGFGIMGLSARFLGAAESNDGTLWFGTSYDHIKRYKSGVWNRLTLFLSRDTSYYNRARTPEIIDDDRYDGWNTIKSDALYVDRNDILWGAYWHSQSRDGLPYIWAYDPQKKAHRYLGETVASDPNVFGIEGNEIGQIFLRYKVSGSVRSTSFHILDGTAVFAESSPSFEELIVYSGEADSEIEASAVSPKGSFIAATNSGIEAFNLRDSMVKGRYSSNYIVYGVTVGESYFVNNDFSHPPHQLTELWAASFDGIRRYLLREYLSGAAVDSIAIERDSSFPLLNGRNGVRAFNSSPPPYSLAYDSSSRVLWASSEGGGVSRISIKTPFERRRDNSEFTVYPNPYIKSRHRSVTIDGLASNSYVDIYTVSGYRVDGLSLSEAFDGMGNNVGYRWKPKSDLSPGAYYIVAKDGDLKDVRTQTLIILP